MSCTLSGPSSSVEKTGKMAEKGQDKALCSCAPPRVLPLPLTIPDVLARHLWGLVFTPARN